MLTDGILSKLACIGAAAGVGAGHQSFAHAAPQKQSRMLRLVVWLHRHGRGNESDARKNEVGPRRWTEKESGAEPYVEAGAVHEKTARVSRHA